MNKKGGTRPGAGRKPGARWTKNGQHKNKIRFSLGLQPELYEWLKTEAQRRDTTMAALINEAIAKAKENDRMAFVAF